jgi:hypothetical protein
VTIGLRALHQTEMCEATPGLTMAETTLPAALTEAVAALWRITSPGPNNLLSDPRFMRLRDICESLYSEARSKDALGIALSHALRALGLPCGLVQANAHLALPEEIATEKLDAAFRRTQASRVCLCPLNLADDHFPALKFGPNSVGKFTATELETLVDLPRPKRINSNWTFDAKRFSEFSWLVVREMYPLDQEPGVRAIPWLFMTSSWDWGRIEPHQERFPTTVEAALFAVLRAPWEDWVEMPENDWCGFTLPWVYTLSDDIFVRPSRPPSPDTLSWEPQVFHDNDGNVVFEPERPERYGLKDAAAVEARDLLNDAAWSDLTRAHQSPLFETPIAHFLVRAFHADGMDEFLAHITTIEAALGLRSDYDRKTRPKIARGHSVTDCMAARVEALLGTKTDAAEYRRLFDLRSLLLHGRKMGAIPGEERIAARRLARRVVNRLIEAALAEPAPQSRENFLNDLLTRGL